MAEDILTNKPLKSKKLEPGTYRVTINPGLRLSIVPATIQKIAVEIYVSGLPVGTTEASLLQNLYYLLDWPQSYRNFEVSIERVEPVGIMRYIASYRRRAAHVVPDDSEAPLCGAEINPKFWGFVKEDQILDFLTDEEIQERRRSFLAWRKSFQLCWFCKQKMEDA